MNPGSPRIAYFAVDALHRLRRPITPTLIAVLIVLAGTLAVFATTGLAVASQQRTLDRINSPEGRLITVTDAQGEAGLSPESVAIAASISGVEWAFGIGPAGDVVNIEISGGTSVPARALYGSLPAPIHSAPGALSYGQALAGPGLARVLGMRDGVGAVTGTAADRDAIVVGGFVAEDPLASLNDNVLVATAPTAGRLLTLWASVHDVSQLTDVTAAIGDALVMTKAGKVRIDTAEELAQLSADVTAELAATARLTVSGLLLAVAVLVAAVQFGRVTGMARDIGRARALGATRSTIVLQILVNAALCGALGAAGGVITGLVVNAVVAGSLPGLGFVVGVAMLMVLASVAGAVAPAIRAARMDPVAILRVP